MRCLREKNDSIGKSHFVFRLADEKVSNELTGYTHNSGF
jgi:hypothetical protein